MNLGRIRLRLTLLFFLLLAVAVVALALVAERLGTSQIYESAERDAEATMSELILAPHWDNEAEKSPHSWRVTPRDEWFDVLGDTDLEPPLLRLAGAAVDGGASFQKFEQLGGTWLSLSRELTDSDGQVLVIALDFEPFESDVFGLRWKLALAVVGLLVFATLAAWWLAGRSLRPARTALGQQRAFIADAAHELRTPLAVIQASASQVLSRSRESWEYERSLSEIQLAAERAGHGVGSLLELARLESGQAEPRLAPLRLDLLLEEVAAATPADNVDVVVEAAEPLIVNADYNLLRQAVGNMVNNAAARAQKVRLVANRQEPWAVLQVIDDGPGFDPAVLDSVFTRFGRGDEKGSNGLGMAIVKTIVDAHRGEVRASNHRDGGAQVEMKLKISG